MFFCLFVCFVFYVCNCFLLHVKFFFISIPFCSPSILSCLFFVVVCLFAFLCHGFVIFLLVFHIITSWTVRVLKELIFQFHGLTTFQIPAPQKRRRTTYPRGPHSQRRKIHHRSHGIWLLFFFPRTLSLAARQRGGCASKLHAFIQVGLSVLETFSLLFHLIYYFLTFN